MYILHKKYFFETFFQRFEPRSVYFLYFISFVYVLFTILLYNILVEMRARRVPRARLYLNEGKTVRMKQKQYRFGIYLPLLFIFMIAAVVIRTVASFRGVDPVTGYYTDKLLVDVSAWVVGVGSAVSATYLLGKKPSFGLTPRYDVAATYIPSGVISVALLFVAYRYAVKYFTANNSASVTTADKFLDLLPLLISITAVLSIVGFFLTAATVRSEDVKRAAFGIAIIVFIVLYSTYLYFDNSVPLNSTVKVTDHMAILFSGIFFISETRISLGRGLWRVYVAFGMIAALTTAYSAIPTLILYLVRGEMMSSSVEECVLILSLFLFVISRLTLTATLRSNEKSSFASAIHDSEKERRGLNGKAEETAE